MGKHFSHFTWADRLQLEAYLKAGIKPKEISHFLNKSVSAIYIEIKRGKCEQMSMDLTKEIRYSPETAERKYRQNLAAKGAELKIGKDHKLAEYIENKIVKDKYSPAAVLGEIKVKGLSFDTTICVKTLYNYIDKEVFLNLSNKDLPVKAHKTKKKYRHVKAKRKSAGTSIEKRPETVLSREDFGHWEMDCVIGKKTSHKTLLVLTERKTRNEIVKVLKAKTSDNVVAALNEIEEGYRNRRFKEVFKTITVDNGAEFSDVEGLEKSIFGGRRTNVYYCHPYSSWERGTNENTNKLVRRHYPKGTDFDECTNEELDSLNDWINEYPRGIFGYRSARDIFNKEITMIL